MNRLRGEGLDMAVGRGGAALWAGVGDCGTMEDSVGAEGGVGDDRVE